MRVVPIVNSNREGDSLANMDTNKTKRKAQDADEPEAKRLKPSSPETIAPVNESPSVTTNERKTAHGEGHDAVEPGHSIFGDARRPTPVAVSRKRMANDADDICTGKRVKTADIDFASLVPAPGSLVPTELRANKDVFPFMFLPTEIRQKIYGHLFKSHKPVCPQVEGHSAANWDRPGFRKGLVLAMVTANKALSKEVTHFIYSNNCFRLSLRDHRHWIHHIGRKNSSLIQEVILVGAGRIKQAPDILYAMLAALWKRAPDNLRRITVHDGWVNLGPDFIPHQLVAFGEKKTWNKFQKLESITIDVPHKDRPVSKKPLYERLCVETEVNITGRHHVLGWHRPLQQGPNGLRTAGTVWLKMKAEEFKERLARDREEKKRAAQLRKEEDRKVRKE